MIPPDADDGSGSQAATAVEAAVATRARPHIVRHHEHHKPITMADIAKEAGVSQGAISSLLNDRDYGIRVSDKTRERVFRVCRGMGYVPNDLRAVVRMYPERGAVCLLVSKEIPSVVTDPFFSRVLAGAMDAVSEQSHSIAIAQYDPGVDYGASQPDTFPHPASFGIASKYLCVGTPNPSLYQALVRRGFAVSCIGHEVALPGVTSILPNFVEASRIAIEYLFNLGHRQIVILSGPFGATEQHIIALNRGVRLGYERAGMSIEAQNIIYGELDFKTGYHSLDVLLNRTPRPTAVLCLNDSAASGLLARAQSKGIKVPGELSVLGCSDDLYSECTHPTLSTIRLPAEEIGATAVAEAERRVNDKEHGLAESKKIVLPVRLVERESCAPPSSSPKQQSASQS
jgi:DNA-binding LacI/PurR family transcriptional regulator